MSFFYAMFLAKTVKIIFLIPCFSYKCFSGEIFNSINFTLKKKTFLSWNHLYFSKFYLTMQSFSDLTNINFQNLLFVKTKGDRYKIHEYNFVTNYSLSSKISQQIV